MKYSGVDRELSDAGSGFCLAARLTESHRFWLPAPGFPGGAAPDPWLIASAFGSWTWSWLATVLPLGVSALASQSKNASRAVVPTSFSARDVFWTLGRPTEIWLPPSVWISGSATPSWSTRWRMMSTARVSASWFTTGVCAVGSP